MSKEPIVSAVNIGKSYWLYPTNFRRVLGCFLGPERVGATPITALSGLTFDLYHGEALALIGNNGAGKSTALQVLAGIIKPSEGQYIARGRLCALLELGSGFNPEFTGRQNIYIAGLLAGLTHDEIVSSEQAIINFAEIGQYIEQPVKFYSSGMFLRLAFAVAIAGKPDILIVDEALAVGDIFFRQKCYARLRELRERGMAVLLVTHNMSDVLEFCNRAVLLEGGNVTFLGDCKEAINRYYHRTQGYIASTKRTDSRLTVDDASTVKLHQHMDAGELDCQWIKHSQVLRIAQEGQISSGDGYITCVLITNKTNTPSLTFQQGETMRIYMECYSCSVIDIPLGSYCIINSRGVVVSNKSSLHFECDKVEQLEKGCFVWFITDVELTIEAGEYTIGGSFGCLDRSFYAHLGDLSSDKLDLVTRISSIYRYATISVVEKMTGTPARRTHNGIANLPGRHRVFVVK